MAETLRGVGGLVFVAHGNHYANELGRRNCVTGEMWKNKSVNIAGITLDVESRNSVSLVQCLAADMGVPVSKVWESIEVLIQAPLKTA